MRDLTDTVNNPNCMGCLSSGDIGMSGDMVAYAHPLCPAHGATPHTFDFRQWDNFGRAMCSCGAYQTEHEEQLTYSLAQLEIRRELSGGYLQNAETIGELYQTKRQIAALGKLLGSE